MIHKSIVTYKNSIVTYKNFNQTGGKCRELFPALPNKHRTPLAVLRQSGDSYTTCLTSVCTTFQSQAIISLQTALSVPQRSPPKQVVRNKYIQPLYQHYKNRTLAHATKARAVRSGTALLFL
jgi:hypothetical protein